ncbi:MAG TPA: uroporphyrinogen decarboxylase family protein [Tepidisphaeraceae bacterium]|jgi:hypothetical protein
MTPRQNVIAALRFGTPERLPHDFPPPYGSDFAQTGMSPSPDLRPANGRGVDEWGAVWDNVGVCSVGEVVDFPLKRWEDFASFKIPDIRDQRRYAQLAEARERAGDKFLLCFGISLYERIHFIRGLENIWVDIYEEPENLCRLIDMLVDMNVYAIERFGAAGCDAMLIPDDWGLQSSLMISPEKWRELWKPRYTRLFKAVHDAGMFMFLHSCGYIVDILDDLIEIGLDAVHMDQQENMGLELLGRRFGGRLTFFSGVDIQTAMHRPTDQVRAYARDMVRLLGRPEGGIIPRWYTDPKGAGHTQEAIDAMCQEFLKVSEEMYGAKVGQGVGV